MFRGAISVVRSNGENCGQRWEDFLIGPHQSVNVRANLNYCTIWSEKCTAFYEIRLICDGGEVDIVTGEIGSVTPKVCDSERVVFAGILLGRSCRSQVMTYTETMLSGFHLQWELKLRSVLNVCLTSGDSVSYLKLKHEMFHTSQNHPREGNCISIRDELSM